MWADPGGVPVLSILPTINLPAASESKGLGSGQADFTIAALTGTDFLTRGHIDVNYGIGRIGAGTGLPRFTQHLVSWSASAEVPGPVTPYLEGFWFSRQDADGGRVVALDTGAIYVINPRVALDGGVQFGLTDAAPGFSAFGGLSLVLGKVLGDHGVHARQREAARRTLARAARGGREAIAPVATCGLIALLVTLVSSWRLATPAALRDPRDGLEDALPAAEVVLPAGVCGGDRSRDQR